MGSNNTGKNTSKNKNTKDKAVKDSRVKELKSYAILSVIAMIAIVFIVNILFDYLLGKTLRYDFSASGKNSISSTTEDFLDSLPSDTDIRIVGLFDKPTQLTSTPYEYTVGLLDDYAKESNGKITVEYINPKTIPSILTELDPSGKYNLKPDTYVVYYEGKCKVVEPLSCFDFDEQYLYYGQYKPIANKAESVFTNAIARLINGYNSKVYVITDDYYPHTQLSGILDSLGVEAIDVRLTSDFKIEDDCDAIVITGLSYDITEAQAQTMIDFIHNKGGSLYVAVDCYLGIQYPNLNNVLKEFNLRITDNVLQEFDTSYLLNANSTLESYLDLAYEFSEFSNARIRSNYSRVITTAGKPESYITTSSVLTSSTSSVSTNMMTLQDEKTGSYSVGMHSEYSDSMSQEVYLFGTLYFSCDTYFQVDARTNTNFVMNIFEDMLNINSEDLVIVDSKPIDDYSLKTDKINSNTISAMSFVFMAVIPLVFVIAGVIVYNRRKNL